RVACGLAEEIEEDERGVLEAEVAGVDLRGEPDGLDPRLLDGPADDEAADAGRPEGVRVVAAVEEDEVDVGVVRRVAEVVEEVLPEGGHDGVDDGVLVGRREAPAGEE